MVSRYYSSGICYNDPREVKDCRYDACITVSDDIETAGNIKIKTLEKGNYITTDHRGSYETMDQTYDKLYEEGFKKYNLAMDKPCIEIYKNSPQDTAEEDLITEIYAPLSS